MNLDYNDYKEKNKMKTVEVSFRHRGKGFEATVALPEDLTEAVSLLGEAYVYECFSEGYQEAQKRQVRGRKKKFLRLDLTQLGDSELQELKRLGLLR